MTSRTATPPTPSPLVRTTGPGRRDQSVRRLRTIQETADICAVSIRTIRRAIDRGDLPAHRIGRLVRISDADIAMFLSASRSA